MSLDLFFPKQQLLKAPMENGFGKRGQRKQQWGTIKYTVGKLGKYLFMDILPCSLPRPLGFAPWAEEKVPEGDSDTYT